MTGARGLLILLAIIVALVVVVWTIGCPPKEETTPPRKRAEPVRFNHEDITVKSPDLEVGPATVRGSIFESYLSWVVIIGCAEPEGCAGEFNVTIDYDTGSESRKIIVDNRCEVPMGGELRFEGFQDPATPVAAIGRLTLDVVALGSLDELEVEEIEL